MIHNSMATFYLNIGEYNHAGIHYFEALKIKEKQVFYSQKKDNQTIKTLSSLYNNIANIKLVLKKYDDALSIIKSKLNITTFSIFRPMATKTNLEVKNKKNFCKNDSTLLFPKYDTFL